MVDYLHNDPDFKDLLAIVAEKEGIDSTLVEKDYWIMHVLHGLQRLGIEFELKGGTSLSKGYGLIERFSEDIDIHIRTDFGLQIEGNADKPKIREARRSFYDRLVDEIKIPGIIDVVRDTAFDDTDKFRSGGIRLHYLSHTPVLEGVKEGILLEVGFDTITPNQPADISSWTLDHVRSTAGLSNYMDNSANGVLCYHPGYTLVEKLQTIVNKYRKEIESEDKPKNFMRQYYDVHCLLNNPEVRSFIGSEAYQSHKIARFRGADKEVPLSEHPALLLPDKNIRESFEARYKNSSKLYYRNQPEFSEILATIQENINLF
jgi:hypothetical protein